MISTLEHIVDEEALLISLLHGNKVRHRFFLRHNQSQFVNSVPSTLATSNATVQFSAFVQFFGA